MSQVLTKEQRTLADVTSRDDLMDIAFYMGIDDAGFRQHKYDYILDLFEALRQTRRVTEFWQTLFIKKSWTKQYFPSRH